LEEDVDIGGDHPGHGGFIYKLIATKECVEGKSYFVRVQLVRGETICLAI
jgi:hypothetical protein